MAAHSPDEIKTMLREFVLEAFLFGDDSEPFTDTDSFMTKGIMDSTGVLELVAYLEEQFEVQVADEEMIPANLDSIDNLALFITHRQS